MIEKPKSMLNILKDPKVITIIALLTAFGITNTPNAGARDSQTYPEVLSSYESRPNGNTAFGAEVLKIQDGRNTCYISNTQGNRVNTAISCLKE
jgi:hypothetical protein